MGYIKPDGAVEIWRPIELMEPVKISCAVNIGPAYQAYLTY